MAVYKVPQDVEADDKLLGPFTFRQFIYLIIMCLFVALAWGLSRLFIPLAIIPLPGILLFGALALPVRKDQPMEMYLAAMVSFYLKPRKRIWNPDGTESLIEITVPKIVEVQRVKDLSQTEAQRRFSYLAQIVDTQGWAIRGAGVQAPNSSVNSDIYYEAQTAEDIMDNTSSAVQTFDDKLAQSNTKRHQQAVNLVLGKTVPAVNNYFGVPPLTTPTKDITNTPMAATATPTEPIIDKKLQYNPYPEDIRQSVIQPIDPSERTAEPAHTASEKVVSADIINLANNTDLSIETIAREANRIQEKHDMSEEVIISLR